MGPLGKHPAGHRVPFPVPDRRWPELDTAQQKAYVMRLLDGLEVVNRDKRLRVARAILYLAQGKDHVPHVWMRPRIHCPGGLGEAFSSGCARLVQ